MTDLAGRRLSQLPSTRSRRTKSLLTWLPRLNQVRGCESTSHSPLLSLFRLRVRSFNDCFHCVHFAFPHAGLNNIACPRNHVRFWPRGSVEPLFGLETPSSTYTKWALFFYMAEQGARLALLYKIVSPKTDNIFWMTLVVVSLVPVAAAYKTRVLATAHAHYWSKRWPLPATMRATSALCSCLRQCVPLLPTARAGTRLVNVLWRLMLLICAIGGAGWIFLCASRCDETHAHRVPRA